MTDRRYIRPIVQTGPGRPKEALPLAGGWGWFTHVEILHRDAFPESHPAEVLTSKERLILTAPRARVAGLDLSRPNIMGILNTTPDSFSDGGAYEVAEDAIAASLAMHNADILDIGGESTRPGAAFIDPDTEVARTAPVIAGLRAQGLTTPISIDTRKAIVARAALNAGANLINDVSGLTFDPDMPAVAKDAAVCVMHSVGTPETMQGLANYTDVLLDVYDWLAARIQDLEATGIPRSHIIADPGIGFGKTLDHNLALLNRLSLFHSLGVPILLGASRKRFIGTISGVEDAQARMPGSLAVALAGQVHGAQILRVHDVAETAQAIALWRACMAEATP